MPPVLHWCGLYQPRKQKAMQLQGKARRRRGWRNQLNIIKLLSLFTDISALKCTFTALEFARGFYIYSLLCSSWHPWTAGRQEFHFTFEESRAREGKEFIQEYAVKKLSENDVYNPSLASLQMFSKWHTFIFVNHQSHNQELCLVFHLSMKYSPIQLTEDAQAWQSCFPS